MIARTWTGQTDPANSDGYLHLLRTVVLPELRDVDGFCGMQVQRRDITAGCEFTVTTLWDSMAAIKRFAGDDPDLAVVTPSAQGLLSRHDQHVRHSEIVLVEPC